MSCTSGCFELPCPPPCPPVCNCTTNDIKYKGVNDTCTGVTFDMFLTEVLTKLATFAKNRLYSILPSDAITVTPSLTTCNKSAQISVKISEDADNIVFIHDDGLYATSTITTYTADRGIVADTPAAHNFRLVESLDGAATKFLWNYPKGAFRAGTVTGTQWDVANTGNYSAAFGHDTIASGVSSFASGESTSATGIGSFSHGTLVSVASNYSTGFGNTLAFGSSAIASVLMGNDMSCTQRYSAGFGRTNSIDATTALAISLGQSFVAGAGLHAHGQNNIILGGTSTTNNDFDIAIGLDNNLSNNYCYAFGRNLLSSALTCVIAGVYNDETDEGGDTVAPGTYDDPAFIVGNGHIVGSPPSETRVGSNGLIVYKSGTVRIKGALDQRDSPRGIIPARWATVNRPASPERGEQGYNTTDDMMEYWNGTIWVQF